VRAASRAGQRDRILEFALPDSFAHVAALSSLSTPRATILTASSRGHCFGWSATRDIRHLPSFRYFVLARSSALSADADGARQWPHRTTLP
jgi:hypothetical protein